MSSYENLAGSYDLFTADVDYSAWADYYEQIFKRFDIQPQMILDLACGTGTLSLELAQRGYEMIGVDASYDMLAVAQQKADECEGIRPMFLCQSMEELDLYGTVDAAICALDSLNYLLSAEAVCKTFERLKYFVRPGGIVIFDLNTETKFKSMDGKSYLRDEENHFCAWSAEYDEEEKICYMMMDLFDREGELWDRTQEEHVERAHSEAEIEAALSASRFKTLARFDELSFECADENSHRIFWIAIREED